MFCAFSGVLFVFLGVCCIYVPYFPIGMPLTPKKKFRTYGVQRRMPNNAVSVERCVEVLEEYLEDEISLALLRRYINRLFSTFAWLHSYAAGVVARGVGSYLGFDLSSPAAFRRSFLRWYERNTSETQRAILNNRYHTQMHYETALAWSKVKSEWGL